MKKQTYSDKLLDPRWQKKRLEILNRDSFKCRVCAEDTKTLHVHHVKYDKELQPWESDNEDLVTLCDSCHTAWHLLDGLSKFDIGWETIVLVADFYTELDYQAMQKWLNEHPLSDQDKIF